MEETISGYVEHVIYRNEENGYTVFILKKKNKEITCVGNLHVVPRGEVIEAKGYFTEHPTYGRQFHMEAFEIKMPEDEVSIERYLASGAIKGIGPSLAAKVVKCFKEETLRILEEEPERLVEVDGIGEKKARMIAQQAAEKSGMRKAMMYLQKYGISLSLGAKIYKHYGDKMYGVMEENPYRLAEDISGIGFKIADEIAAKMGISRDSEFRIKSAMIYLLSQAALSGNIYLPWSELERRTEELLGLSQELLLHLQNLAVERKVVLKKEGEELLVYSSQLYHLELDVARRLCECNFSENIDARVVEKRIRAVEEELDTRLDELQHQAVMEAAQNGVFILTGGPGTGKTTTINTMIRYFLSQGMQIALAAPTGRAAKRMAEATGYEASTLHRLLEISGAVEESNSSVHFEKDEDNPLEADVVIIDEMSMVDIYLIHALLSAVTAGTRLIFVGDIDQLPSVGPGNVLKDMIQAQVFHVVRLHKIFRQASASDIVVNAHKINRGQQISINNKSRDFFFLKRYDNLIIQRILVSLIQEKLPSYIDGSPMDIQVLTPMRKGVLGVESLNSMLQKYLNPPDASKKEREAGQRRFRQGDKVMQTKNNYQLEWEIRGLKGIAIDKGVGIFNGDIGIVRDFNDFTEEMLVEFDEGRFVDYPYSQLDELELAYAITIHKSQGSEYPAVILPLLGGPKLLMYRNILYTAVTRAKKCVVVVGSEETFASMIENERESERCSSLDLRIMEFAGVMKEQEA